MFSVLHPFTCKNADLGGGLCKHVLYKKVFYYIFVFIIFLFLPIFQDGVNWLAFLNKYKLHGILCDDMGLGKTLQSICILAGDHCHR